MKLSRILVVAVLLLLVVFWRPALFFTGGGLVSAGHMVQGFVGGFSRSGEVGTPDDLLKTVLIDNESASRVERVVSGPRRKPEVLAVMCMDPRLNSEVVLGDSRGYYDVVRLPGSVLSGEMIEAIELGVKEHQVELVLFTTHTDCAMEKVAHSEAAEHFPALSNAVHKREEMFQALMSRPLIAQRVKEGKLLVKRFRIETPTGKLLPEEQH
ncbi:MAG: hypothetical protein IT168_16620 [Bryobacterales bacterium]|nr:hypothetical protein [Bryobacterales bacterium]